MKYNITFSKGCHQKLIADIITNPDNTSQSCGKPRTLRSKKKKEIRILIQLYSCHIKK